MKIVNCRAIGYGLFTALLMVIGIQSTQGADGLEIASRRAVSSQLTANVSTGSDQAMGDERLPVSGAQGASTSSLSAPAIIQAAGLFSGGGAEGISSSFRLMSTVSQTAVGYGQYGANRADHGFWQVLRGLSTIPCCGQFTGGFTGNTDCDTEGNMNMLDITVLIDHVYISRRDLCCQANGNIDPNNGELINLSDITRLIDHIYISKAQTAACQ